MLIAKKSGVELFRENDLVFNVGSFKEINDNDRSITYQGSWVNESKQGTYNNDDPYSNVTDASFTVTFNGTQIAWYGAKGPAKGTAAVSIDGGAETIADTSVIRMV